MQIIDILIAVGYTAILFFCVNTAFCKKPSLPQKQVLYHRLIFTGIAAVLVILLISRFFNINDLITNETRMLAKNENWYNERRPLQMLFVCMIFISAIMLFLIMEKKSGIIWKLYSMFFTGIILLTGFIVISAASYHPVDQLLRKQLVGIRYSRIIEFVIIVWIIISISISKRRYSLKTEEYKISQGTKFI